MKFDLCALKAQKRFIGITARERILFCYMYKVTCYTLWGSKKYIFIKKRNRADSYKKVFCQQFQKPMKLQNFCLKMNF